MIAETAGVSPSPEICRQGRAVREQHGFFHLLVSLSPCLLFRGDNVAAHSNHKLFTRPIILWVTGS